MKQLSVRGFDPMLEKKIREIARTRGISLNRAAICLMQKGAGFTESGKSANVVGDSLDRIIGKWSKEEADAFLQGISPLEKIDRSFWK
jgi:hypothetical protein